MAFQDWAWSYIHKQYFYKIQLGENWCAHFGNEQDCVQSAEMGFRARWRWDGCIWGPGREHPGALHIGHLVYILPVRRQCIGVQYLMNTSRLWNHLKTVDWLHIIHMTSWHFAILCVARSNTNVQYTRRAPVYQFSVTVHCTSVLALHQCNSALHHLDLHLTSLHFETTGDQESKMHPLPSSASNALQCVERQLQ